MVETLLWIIVVQLSIVIGLLVGIFYLGLTR